MSFGLLAPKDFYLASYLLTLNIPDESDISRIWLSCLCPFDLIAPNIYRLIHGHFHIGLVIIPRPPYLPETESRANMGQGMITRSIWKCPCIKLFITYFQHLEKIHPYWPETKSMPILARAIWASIWK